MEWIAWIWIITVCALFALPALVSLYPRSKRKTYLGLRNLILQGSRKKFRIGPASKPTQPYGVLMDWGIRGRRTTSVVALANGTASVYISRGGGFLGGGEVPGPIRDAAKKTVEIADEVQPLMQITTKFPLARRGEVIFYLLTDTGIFTASASEADLTTQRSPLFRLNDAAQGIITEYRLFRQASQSRATRL